MVYSFHLCRHPNIHYREALMRLSRCELFSMLQSLSVCAEPQAEKIGAADFLTFECRELSLEELSFLAGHSSVDLLCERQDRLLRPLPVSSSDLFPGDLPEILKYKGKTNPSFTRMMLNTALSLSRSAGSPEAVTALDPLCGKGTTLFCAACMGISASGVETDGRSLKELSDCFSRYLQSAGVKYSVRDYSETAEGKGIPGKCFSYAASREDYKAGKKLYLNLFHADSSLAGTLLRKAPADILVADLPYGVQHAPLAGGGMSSFSSFLSRMLPSWKKALKPGAAAALSFNTLTLKAESVRSALQEHGFHVIDTSPYTGLAHAVEHAVTRDLVFAVLP